MGIILVFALVFEGGGHILPVTFYSDQESCIRVGETAKELRGGFSNYKCVAIKVPANRLT